MKHYVTVEISVEAPHYKVQSRVLTAVEREFQDREPGILCVTGFDREGHEKALARVKEERDEYRKGWLELGGGGVKGGPSVSFVTAPGFPEKCDRCGCRPSVIYRSERGTLCGGCHGNV